MVLYISKEVSTIMTAEDLAASGSQTDIAIEGFKSHTMLIANLEPLWLNNCKTVIFKTPSKRDSVAG